MENDRTTATSLRLPDRGYRGRLAYDATDAHSHFSPIRSTLRPHGAPNVLIAWWGDVGFGTATTYGEPGATSTAEQLAAAGPRFNRFHAIAPCSLRRAAILSGRTQHEVGMGGITQRYVRGLTGLNEHSFIDAKNKSRTIAIAQGGGTPSVDGGSGPGHDASVTVLMDESPVATGHIDHGSPVPDRYPDSDSSFSGEIEWVQIEPADDSYDHFITVGNRLKLATARQ